MNILKAMLLIAAVAGFNISVYAMERKEGCASVAIVDEEGIITATLSDSDALYECKRAIQERKTSQLRGLLVHPYINQYIKADVVWPEQSLLTLAAKGANLPAMVSILKAGADPNGCKHSIPLEAAVEQRFTLGVKLLLKYGADTNMSIGKGYHSLLLKELYLSARDERPNKEVFGYVPLLLQYGANPNLTDNLGKGSLHEGIVTCLGCHSPRNIALMKMLLQAGARNVPDISRNTPLHEAVKCHWIEAVRAIITSTTGENIELKNQYGLTAADIADKAEWINMKHLLEHWPYECAKAKLCEHYGESGNNHNPSMLKMIQAREVGAKLKLRSSRKNYSSK